MSTKYFLVFVLVLQILPAGAEDLSKNRFKRPVEILSEPGKLVPDSSRLTKDCSPQEKLVINCRAFIEKVRKQFQNFKDESEKLIRIHDFEISDMLKKTKMDAPELKGAVETYKNIKSPTKKDAARILELVGISPKSEYNCLMGPDFFLQADPEYGRCSSGFTYKDVYEVTRKTLEIGEDRELSLVICRDISFVPSSFKICGSRNLENGALWVDTVGASKKVTKIKEVQVSKEISGVLHFERGEEYDLYNLSEMVEREVRAKHKKCVPFLPKSLN